MRPFFNFSLGLKHIVNHEAFTIGSIMKQLSFLTKAKFFGCLKSEVRAVYRGTSQQLIREERNTF